jgi:hypothetical protein
MATFPGSIKMTIEDLSLDLRRAYRLVHGYQRALLDLTRQIGAELGLDFYYWEPMRQGRPARSSTQPANNWAWDMLPLYSAAFCYVTPGPIRPGSIILKLMAEADSSYEKLVSQAGRGEPDYRKMPVPEQCETRLGFWYVEVLGTATRSKVPEFWESLADEDWPESSEFPLSHGGLELRGGLIYKSISCFSDSTSAKAAVEDFRERLLIKNGGD